MGEGSRENRLGGLGGGGVRAAGSRNNGSLVPSNAEHDVLFHGLALLCHRFNANCKTTGGLLACLLLAVRACASWDDAPRPVD